MIRLTSRDPFNRGKVRTRPSGHLDGMPDGNCQVPYGSPAFPSLKSLRLRKTLANRIRVNVGIVRYWTAFLILWQMGHYFYQ
ncbi:hypothetical protein NPIL_578371 [Nephila pilipes]|uniref:Uncharacterized protein n=1 Tax=Nephila pilipes TaxID=299642 RepID=A0A8X6P699_NEPPI|nr:hypothetical protein NPIL_578371 [Nephila pilipes]